MNAEIPADFFSDVKDAKPDTSPRISTALRWYDGIIDDILANPGTSVKDTAARLGRHPHTISAICASDLFRARWEQRRAQFNIALDLHLSNKLAQVAEKALDHTIEQLDKKRDSIPLPILKELAMGSLDRLGYGPSQSERAQVVINNQVPSDPNRVSAEGLARARERLTIIDSPGAPGEESRSDQALPGPTPVSQEDPREACVRRQAEDLPPPVAGPEAREGGS